MKLQFDIEDRAIIDKILQNAQYGTLALCRENIPYSLPINFVYRDEVCYFHGEPKGKKMDIIRYNPFASFSVVEPYCINTSSNRSGELVCESTYFFKSVIIDGEIAMVDGHEDKCRVVEYFKQKLQPQSKSLDEADDLSVIDSMVVFKITPKRIKGKIKIEEYLSQAQFDRVINYLKEHNNSLDSFILEKLFEE